MLDCPLLDEPLVSRSDLLLLCDDLLLVSRSDWLLPWPDFPLLVLPLAQLDEPLLDELPWPELMEP